MGLFALVSLNIIKRTKEFGIRKVLGANIFNIGYLVSREFIFVLLAASVTGSLLGYLLVDTFMTSIWAYHVDFGFIPFVLSSLLMIGVALLTVSTQVVSASQANPIDSIRYE
jgi:putative ABC transport system permease protein